jgi:hypothetical protein
MKTITTLLLSAALFVCVSNLYAQDGSEPETLFGNSFSKIKKNIGHFEAPTFGVTSMDGSIAFLASFRGGIILNEKISLGAYYVTSVNEVVPESETLSDVYMDYWSFGGVFEYTIKSKKLVHVSFPLYIGLGEVQMDNDEGDAGLGEANFFQIEPSALLEVNLHKYVRLNMGAGYRMVGAMQYRNFDQSDISGFTGYVGLKFGLFK